MDFSASALTVRLGDRLSWYELLTDYAGPLALLVGYGFAVFVEAIFVKNLVDTLWDGIAPGGVASM